MKLQDKQTGSQPICILKGGLIGDLMGCEFCKFKIISEKL